MRKIHLLCTLVLTIFCGSISYAQDFSNKGKDFWVAYGFHQSMVGGGNSQDMVLYFAAEQATNVTVAIPALGYSQTYVVPANTTIASAALPKAGLQDCRLTAESSSPERKGIHITSDKPIVAYSHIYNSSVSGATILFPTATLGREYYSVNFTNISNSTNANCWFYVVAADTGTTTVEITPSALTSLGRPAGTPFTVSLTQGQVFNVMGQYSGSFGVDLSGSKIQSINTGSGCKRIAVFSGSGRISITCNSTSSSSDNYMVQAFPKSAWGKKYLTVPSVDYNTAAGNTSSASTPNIYRVNVSDPTTIVRINGVVTSLPLTNNFFYEIPATTIPQLIEADKPVVVSQYFPSRFSGTAACGVGAPADDGDPEVLYLSSVEQNINKVLWNANAKFDIDQQKHYINVVIPNTGTAISSFTLDGTSVPASNFVIHPQDPGFSYAKLNISSNSGPAGGFGIPHIIQSDSGFNAIAYGYGVAESYGYNAGTNIKDIFQYVSVQNQFATVNFPATCRNAPFYFSMTFPYQPTSIQWVFNGLFPDFTMMNPATFFTGSIVVAGKTLYQYRIPTPYTIAAAGVYPIKVLATNPTSDGCNGIQEIDYDIQVFNSPVADFTSNNVCFPSPVLFTDNSTTDGRAVTTRNLIFGDATTPATSLPISHAYAAPGQYTVQYSIITDIGCVDTTERIINVSPLPTASISGSTQACVNDASPNITFTGGVGTAPFTFTYNINGGANQTVTTTSGNSVTVAVPTTTAGTFTYNLISVRDGSPAACSQNQTGSVVVQINQSATAAITGGVSVCRNSPSQTITFTGGGSPGPYTFTYTINGGPNQTVTTAAGNSSITVSAPTTVAGTFIYNVVSVQGSTGACPQTQNVSTTVTITELPTASVAGTTEVCLNAASPLITFTGAIGPAPYTFTYNINGGPNQTINTTSGNSVTVSVPTTTAGTFTYNLVSIADASASLCSQAQTGSATITVNPLPTTNFSISAATCTGAPITFTDLSAANAGAINGWNWNFGDATTSTLQNPTHTYAAAGTYTVTLSVTTDKGCTSNPVFSRTVTVNPLPVTDFTVPEICVSDINAPFFDNSTVATGTITGWTWNFGDPGSGGSNTSTLQNPTHTFSTPGNFTITLTTTSNSGCQKTTTKPMFVNGAAPNTDFIALNPATMCANDSIAIQDASTIGFGFVTKVEIYWDNAGAPGVFETDNNPTTGKIYRHKYPNFQTPLTRTYTIRYRAYSGATCVNDRTRTITINAAPLVQFNNIPPACLDATPFQITQASEIGAVPGTGVFSGPGVNAAGIFNPASVGPGTYTIKYTFTSSAGGCVDTLSKPITILDSASARFTITGQACDRSAITFNSTTSTIPAASGTITGWAWDFGDPASGGPANISTLQNPSHVFSSWGTYNVRLVVFSSNGCRSAAQVIPVTVNPIPRANFTLPASLCLPSANATFNNTSSIADGSQGSFTYLWNFGDPGSGASNTATGSSPSHIYTTAGPFSVNLQVTSAAGCVHDTTILLSNIHPEPTGSFTVDKTDVCIGQSFTFTDNSNPADGTTAQWSWNLADGNTRSTPTFTYTYPAAGVYDVTLFITNSFGCRSSTATRRITVNPYPTVNAGPDLFILEDGSDTIRPIITATNPTYLWTPNLYFLSSNTVMNPVVKGVVDITYTITVTGQGDCVASDQVFIKVLKGPEIPNIFSPNADGIHDKWIIKYLETYPDGTVEVFNRYGQRIFQSKGYNVPWDGTVDGKPVPMGTYYYIVNPKNGRKIMSGYVDVIR